MIRKEKLFALLAVPDEVREKYKMVDFPTVEEINKAADYLGVSEADLYFNPNGDSAIFLYYKEIVLIELPEQLTIEDLELTKMKAKIKQTHASLQQFINRDEWKRLFLFIDQRIAAPAFDELFSEIPEAQKKEVFAAIKKRLGTYPVLNNETALQMISKGLI
jgi:hypothetical protein